MAGGKVKLFTAPLLHQLSLPQTIKWPLPTSTMRHKVWFSTSSLESMADDSIAPANPGYQRRFKCDYFIVFLLGSKVKPLRLSAIVSSSFMKHPYICGQDWWRKRIIALLFLIPLQQILFLYSLVVVVEYGGCETIRGCIASTNPFTLLTHLALTWDLNMNGCGRDDQVWSVLCTIFIPKIHLSDNSAKFRERHDTEIEIRCSMRAGEKLSSNWYLRMRPSNRIEWRNFYLHSFRRPQRPFRQRVGRIETPKHNDWLWNPESTITISW